MNGVRPPGLPYRHHLHPIDIDVIGQVGDVGDLLGNVFRRQRNGPLVDGIRCRCITAVANHRKLGFGNSRGQIGDSHPGAEQVTAQVVGKLFDKRLAGAVNVTAGVGPLTGGGADVDDVGPGACFDQCRQQRMGYIDHPGDVGVDHGMQVAKFNLLHGRWRQCQAGIVDQRMDLAKT